MTQMCRWCGPRLGISLLRSGARLTRPVRITELVAP
jgi:hypothetical protein